MSWNQTLKNNTDNYIYTNKMKYYNIIILFLLYKTSDIMSAFIIQNETSSMNDTSTVVLDTFDTNLSAISDMELSETINNISSSSRRYLTNVLNNSAISMVNIVINQQNNNETTQVSRKFEEKLLSLSCNLPLIPNESRLWRGNETHELLLPRVVCIYCFVKWYA